MIKPEQLIPLLNMIKAQGVEFKAAVVGGVAAIAHGVYRATLDLDILVDSGDYDLVNFKTAIQKILDDNENIIPGLEELGPLSLESHMAVRPGSNESLKNALVVLFDKNGDRMIDFLGCYWKYDKKALDSSIPLEGFEPLGVIDAPYLILMKSKANSPKDQWDIYEIFHQADDIARLKILDVMKEYGRSKLLQDILQRYEFEIAEESELDESIER